MSSKKNCVFITGGAGFIGSEFVRQIVRNSSYKVHVLDCLTYAGDLARLKEVRGKFTFHKVNICDKASIDRLFKRYKPDIFCHFAAETHVDRSILYSQIAVKTNVLGTQVLLEAAKNFGIKRFVYISTDEVYGEVKRGQFYETTPLNPSSPYSVGKAAGDMLLKAYVRTYDFPGVIVRPSNNYGPWQYPEKLIPVVIYKALHNQKIPVYGKGVNVREWLHVSDCARGVLTVMKKGKIGEAYNIGSGNERKNIVVVKTILNLLKKGEDLIEFVKDRPGHDLRYSLNFNKIKRQLEWGPKVKFEAGMKQTVQFYLSHQKWLNAHVKKVSRFWGRVYKKK